MDAYKDEEIKGFVLISPCKEIDDGIFCESATSCSRNRVMKYLLLYLHLLTFLFHFGAMARVAHIHRLFALLWNGRICRASWSPIRTILI